MNSENNWFKPYMLNRQNIEKVIGAASAGVYVLGNLDSGNKFRVRRIRSGSNVKNQLYENLGKFQAFMYRPVKHLQHMF